MGYDCPVCGARHCSIPCYCKICGLLLTTSAHLMRTRNQASLDLFYHISNPLSYGPSLSETAIRERIWRAITLQGAEVTEATQTIRCCGCEAPIEVCLARNEGLIHTSVCPRCISTFCLYSLIFISYVELAMPSSTKLSSLVPSASATPLNL